jgi:hypothetical protein
MGLNELPLQFGVVSGSFWCQGNHLTTLSGSPNEVCGNFICSGNKLATLHGAPNKVADNFLCDVNFLTSLDGSPQKVGGVFDCSNNRLNSLEGAPKEIGGSFACNSNHLLTLDGAPDKIGHDFLCRRNPLEAFGAINTQFRGEFVSNPFGELVNFQCTRDEEGYLWVSSDELNPYIQQLRRIRDEKSLLEAQLAKLVKPYDRAKEGPLPSELAEAKPKMKHKI